MPPEESAHAEASALSFATSATLLDRGPKLPGEPGSRTRFW